MELFCEIYGCYYTVLARILAKAHSRGITQAGLEAMIQQSGFEDTAFHLLPKLIGGQWPLLTQREGRYHSVLSSGDTKRPLSTLEQAWLKALAADPRMGLFLDDGQRRALDGALAADPLFKPEDFYVYDAAKDGDPYWDETYREQFRVILSAIQNRQRIYVEYEGGKGRLTQGEFAPWRLNYSPKDDKFRLLAAACFRTRSRRAILNLARIRHVKATSGFSSFHFSQLQRYFTTSPNQAHILLRIYPQRNALERTMLQFAAYQKETEYDEQSNSYLCRIFYDPTEETDLLIRILSFGPTVKALAPASFVAQLKKRITQQIDLNTKLSR